MAGSGNLGSPSGTLLLLENVLLGDNWHLSVLSEEFLIEDLELGAQVQDFVEEGLLEGLRKVLGPGVFVESLQVASLFLGAPSLLVGGRELFCEILLEVGANKVLIYTYLLMQGG